MKVLVIGANGFVGSNVADVLTGSHDVFRASRHASSADNTILINLLNPESIKEALLTINPEAIIQCAGVVDNNESASNNPLMTKNLLDQVVALGVKPKIIICGSAAEYGLVATNDSPVKESAPSNATSLYAVSKVQETQLALEMLTVHRLPIVVARIFNPIGPGMHPKFLIPRIIEQIKDIKAGKRQSIEVSRLDARRDYIDVRDVARAVKALVEGTPQQAVYNIGSGKSTSNGELVELILGSLKLEPTSQVIETLGQPEPPVASQADITSIQTEFGWCPKIPIEVTIQEIIEAEKQ